MLGWGEIERDLQRQDTSQSDERLALHCGISADLAVARHSNEETRDPMPAGCATQLT
jgi:hypothetical protein